MVYCPVWWWANVPVRGHFVWWVVFMAFDVMAGLTQGLEIPTGGSSTGFEGLFVVDFC